MKSLYININNEQIQSNEELEVLNYDLDSDFFFYLGEKIAKGCKVENENALITDFNTKDNEEDYRQIIAQWNEIKAVLFSERCEGKFSFTLPEGYIHWMKFHPLYVSVYDINFSQGESVVISIDLEELYEDSVEYLQRKILRKLQHDDLYLEIDEIVFNDDAVTRKSPIVRRLKEKYSGIGFKSYKKWSESFEDAENDSLIQQEESPSNDFLYLIRKNEDVLKILNKDGSLVNQLETILIADSKFHAYFQSNMPPYLLGLNTADDNLYFISAKQILCLGNWIAGKLYVPLFSRWYNSELRIYDHRSSCYDKEVIVHDDFKTFCIKDKYDYTTCYNVENGICKCQTDLINTEINSELPYVRDKYADIPTSISTQTGEKVIIPGFKANIYLGSENGTDIFWVTKKCQPGQFRFKESFIADKKGNILRNHEFHLAFPLAGKYILNIHNYHLKSISKLNGDIVMKCDIKMSDIDILNYKEIEPDVFRFGHSFGLGNTFLFLLVKEKVFCQKYNKYYYCIFDKLYKRTDNQMLGEMSDSIKNGFDLPDNMFFAKLFKRNDTVDNLYRDGELIYQLKDKESVCLNNRDDGLYVCGISENRIIINVDSRYYKILDYNSNEIARIDFTNITDCYYNGKLYYYSGTQLGYYDYCGMKHSINYKATEYIDQIEIVSSDFLIIRYKTRRHEKAVIIDMEGNIVIEAKRITLEPIFKRYLEVLDENYNNFIYDNTCKMLAQLDSGDKILILE